MGATQTAYAQTDIPISRHWVYAPEVNVPEPVEPKEAAIASPVSSPASQKDLAKYTHRPQPIRRIGIRPHAPHIGPGPRVSLEEAIRASTVFDLDGNHLLNFDSSQGVPPIKAGTLELEAGEIRAYDGVEAVLDGATFEGESIYLGKNEIHAAGSIHLHTDASTMTADSLHITRSLIDDEDAIYTGDSLSHPLVPQDYANPNNHLRFQGVFEAYALKLREGDHYFESEHLMVDTQNSTGQLRKARGRIGVFYFNADALNVTGPGSFEAENIWLTTCDAPTPHYRIRIKNAVVEDGHLARGKKVRFQFRKFNFPLYIPRVSGIGREFDHGEHFGFDLDVGNETDLGYYLNLGQWYTVSPNVDMAYRFYPTSSNGIGGGVDVKYDFMDDPASRLFRSTGEINSLYTTREDGYLHWYHRNEVSDNTVVLTQWEQWYSRDFLKKFYRTDYGDRTGPRTFTNMTHLGENYILSATASKSTHDFTNETEKYPEASLHFLERHLGKQLYLSMDSYAGYYRQEPTGIHGQRYAQVARLSYDWNVKQGLNILPFIEGGMTHYSQTLDSNHSDTQFTGLAGITTQARFQRAYTGRGQFEGFKHLIVPSVSYINQDTRAMDLDTVPRFDDIDDRPIRDRVEAKIDQILIGRNKVNGDTWRVAQLTVYQGYDLSNEASDTKDFEVDFQIRPRPWWGFRTIAERYRIEENPGGVGNDYQRIINYLFYNNSDYDNTWNARLGYVLTEIDAVNIERTILYGAGYKLSEAWTASAEHEYSLERDELVRERYELRRRLHMWEMGFMVRKRPDSTDFNVIFSLVGIRGADAKF